MHFQTAIRRPFALLAVSQRANVLDSSALRDIWSAVKAQPAFEDRSFDLAVLGGSDSRTGSGDASGPLRRGCVVRAGSGGVQAGDVLVTVPWAAVLAERVGDSLADQKLAGRLLAAVRGARKDSIASAGLETIDAATVWRLYEKRLLPLSFEMDGAAFWAPNEVRALQLPHSVQSQLLATGGRLQKQRTALAGNLKLPSGAIAVSERDEVLGWCQRVVRSRSLGVDDVDGVEHDNLDDIVVADESSVRDEQDASSEASAWRVLCPIVDLFNHNPESPATQAAFEASDSLVSPWRLVRSADGNSIESFQLTAPYGASEGEELLLPYGVETNLELLSAYGFLLPGALNEADYVEIFEVFGDLVDAVKAFNADEELNGLRAGKETVACEGRDDSSTSAAQLEARLSVLEDLDASAAPLAIRPGAPKASAHLLGCAAYLLASEQQAALFEEAFSPSAGHFTLQPVVDTTELEVSITATQDQHTRREAGWPALLEKRARAVVAMRCRHRLESAPTTMAEDEAALAKVLGGELRTLDKGSTTTRSSNSGHGFDDEGTARRRELLALEYRLNVKRLLGAWSEVPGEGETHNT